MKKANGETNSLPEKVVEIDFLRINRNIGKRCRCENKKFIVDPQNRSVYCGACGSIVDPYEALYYLAEHYERLEDEVKILLEQRRQIMNYKPHLTVFRELERQYRGKKMIPVCPHCKRGFFFEEIKAWINPEFEKKLRSREIHNPKS